MSITSFDFAIFIAILVVAYYNIPKQFQWISLLVGSCIFYLSYGNWFFIWITITALTTWIATNKMDKLAKSRKEYVKQNKATLTKEEIKEYKNKNNKKRKSIMIACLLTNFGILAAFKYLDFCVETLNTIFTKLGGNVEIQGITALLIPIGISFYTFQTMGYLIDVYWEKYDAEKNFFKVLLCVSYFPQIIQGPISNVGELREQLFAKHEFLYKNFSYGCQRILCGLMKKLVLADRLSPYVADIMQNHAQYNGLTVLMGAFMYSLQIYADFSGYMDIVIGISELFGVKLEENFVRPYFSKSVAEYWRRWHITLGTWFKTYLYYPIAMAKGVKKIEKCVQKVIGAKNSRTIPAVIALIVVWFTTGLWHGASWAYIIWGGVNGFFIILSMELEGIYEKIIKILHINTKTYSWRAFQVIRTFILVTLIKVLPEVGTLSDGLSFWKSIVVNFQIPTSFKSILLPEMHQFDYLIFIVGALLIFLTSLIQRKQSIRDFLHSESLVVRWACYIAMFFIIIMLGSPSIGLEGGFMYARF